MTTSASAKKVFRRDGRNSRRYLGVLAETPPNIIWVNRDPETKDYRDHVPGDEWGNYLTFNIFKMLSKKGNIGVWSRMASAVGDVKTLKDDAGTVILPAADGAISIKGGEMLDSTASANTVTLDFQRALLNGQIPIGSMVGPTQYANITAGANVTVTNAPNGITISSSAAAGGEITIVSDSGTTSTSVGNTVNVVGTAGKIAATGDMGQTLTLTTGASVPTSFTTGTGSAVPAAGVLTVAGAQNINTSAAGSTVTANLNKSITQPNTNAAGTEGLYTLGTTDFISNYGTDNTFIGGAGNRTLTVATANQNTAIGSGALVSLVDVSQDNVAIGFNALGAAQNVNDSIAIGANALGLFTVNAAPIGHNIAIGSESLGSITTSQNNTAVGTNSGLSMLSAGGNAEGGQNTFLGHNTGFALTRANYNTFVGYNVARNQQFGGATGIARQNVALGSGAGWYWEDAESGNISLGSGCIAGESNVTRIGNTPDVIDVPGTITWSRQTKCLIAGIRGITTDVADAIAVLVDSNGQLGTVSSSIRFKENVEDMGVDSEKIYDLRPVTFNYKADESKKKQYGLIAEEVAETFPHLAVKDHEGNIESVKYHEMNTLLLNELIKLRKRVEELESTSGEPL